MKTTTYPALQALVTMLAIATSAIAQESKIVEPQQKQMEKLSFMEGNWEGSGWIMGPERIKNEFAQTESIHFKLDQTALLIEGRGTANGQVMHDALAIINYDLKKGHYNFRSYVKDGRSGDYKAELIDDQFFWYPSSSMRYIISINKDGQWHEIGEISKGGNWYQFFEMTLNKK